MTRTDSLAKEPQLVAVALAAVLLLCASCAGYGPDVSSPVLNGQAATDAQRQALDELDNMAARPTLDAGLSQLLAAELRRVLLAMDPARLINAAPHSGLSRVDDLVAWDNGTGGAVFRWTYRNQGDYNQDGLVSVNDLTPIGQHYLQTADDPNWPQARQADGNQDGQVNVSDITPIGQQFNNTLTAYLIEYSSSGSPDSGWQQVAEIPFSAGEIMLPGAPRRFNHVLDSPVNGGWYRAVPHLDGEGGIAGIPIQFTAAAETPAIVSGTCFNHAGEPLPGVTLSLPGVGKATSQADGTFALEVTGDYSGVLTPAFPGLSFEPASRTILVTGADLSGQDFTSRSLPAYYFYIDPADIAALDADVWSDEYKTGDFTAAGITYENVGFRYRGGTARTFPKKSWKVSFNEDNEYDDGEWGYRRSKLNLNAEYTDATLMREMLSYDLAHDVGMLAPRARFVRVFINDEYQGLYTDVENPRRGWLGEFGMDTTGALYQSAISKMEVMDTYDEYLLAFDKELLEDEPYDDVIGLIEALDTLAAEDAYAPFQEWLEMEQFRNYMVVYCLMGMADHINTNFFLYNDVNGTGKWWIVPWDHDRTWGHRYDPELGFFSLEIYYYTAIDYGSYDCEEAGGVWGNTLYDRYLNNDRFWQEYTDELLHALDTYFAEDVMIARIDSYYSLIREAALADPLKWGDNTDYGQRIEDLREYVRLRHDFIRDSVENWPAG